MNIKVKQIGLWRTEVPRRPGALAAALEPLAQQGADLKVVRVRSAPGRAKRNIVEIYAGEGRRAATVARAAGFSLSPATTLLMHIGVRDHEAGVVDQRFSSTLTFATESDAKKAAAVIRKVIRAGATSDHGAQ